MLEWFLKNAFMTILFAPKEKETSVLSKYKSKVQIIFFLNLQPLAKIV